MDGDGMIALSIIASSVVMLFAIVPAPFAFAVLALTAAWIAVEAQ